MSWYIKYMKINIIEMYYIEESSNCDLFKEFKRISTMFKIKDEVLETGFLITEQLESLIDQKNFSRILRILEINIPDFKETKTDIKFKLLKLNFLSLLEKNEKDAEDFLKNSLLSELKAQNIQKKHQTKYFINKDFIESEKYKKILNKSIKNLGNEIIKVVNSYFFSNFIGFKEEAETDPNTFQSEISLESIGEVDNEEFLNDIVMEIVEKKTLEISVLENFKSFIEAENNRSHFNFDPNLLSECKNNLTNNIICKGNMDEKLKFSYKLASEEEKNLSLKSDSGKNVFRVISKIIPKQTREKFQKDRIPFLKEFNLKFTKRENIDKKIIRKFRKYLADRYAKDKSIFDNNRDNKFWFKFIQEGLYPPTKFENKEFRSFNTSYVIWIFSHSESKPFFELFLEKSQEIVNSILKKNSKSLITYNENERKNIEHQLKFYISNYANLYILNDQGNQDDKTNQLISNDINIEHQKIEEDNNHINMKDFEQDNEKYENLFDNDMLIN